MESAHASSVAIDGEVIRRIREEKRLTQLYVAKVVGVTTDTVSRWENKRYPTIRRDNAIKLAEALEAELEEILKQDEPPLEPVAETPGEEPGRRRWLLFLGFLFLGAVALIYFLQNNSYRPPQLRAKRLIPAYAAPGSRVLVRVKLSSEKPLKGMILREEFPRGWTLVEADPPASSLDNLEGMARWIFRNPQQKMTVSYLLVVAPDAEPGAKVEFSGELIANPDGRRFAAISETSGQMQVRSLHWADTNGDQVIDDLEILEVSDLIDETGRLHLGWERIEQLWEAGGYQWSAEQGVFVPVWPLSEGQKSAEPPADQ